MTLDSDSEDIHEVQKSPQAEEAGLLDSNFSFDVRDSYSDLLDEGSYSDDLVRKGSKPVRRFVSYLVVKPLPLQYISVTQAANICR